MSKGQIRFYGASGCGINLSLKYAQHKSTEGFADIHTCFIDTSLSNLPKDGSVKEDQIFIFEGIDGSGKLRSTNYHEISKNIKAMVLKFPPMDVNLVAFSASGGSGNIIGSLLIKELLEKNQTVVALVVGSEESKITTENTVKALQSLDSISRKVNKPIVMAYVHNSPENTRTHNDTLLHNVISSMAVLASRENRELDTCDVANFIDFSKVTSVKEGLSLLYINSDANAASEVEYPIAIASLMHEYGAIPDNLQPEYATVGYPLNDVLKGADLHFVISQARVEDIFNKLKDRLKRYEESAIAKPKTSALVDNNASVEDDGMVF
jgi:hypothetical protein|nr:MAG TPA: tubulin [Caudoviricetes sp.]DAY32658.1 MAG TPA: tubulin [Caudoviricetes sp.]